MRNNEVRLDAFSNSHPFVSFFYFLVVLFSTMFISHPVILAISFLAALCYSCRLLGFKKVLKLNFLLTIPGLLIVALINPLFNHYGVTTLFYLKSSGNRITLEALVYGLVLGCVLFIVILWFACYNKVMTSDKFIFLFGKIIPAMSLILSMVLRFVPKFGKQVKVIRNAQKCSGHDISNGNLLSKVKSGLAIISILVTWALENAIDTADSMKSRGYGLRGRTAFSNYRMDRRDIKLTILMIISFTIFLISGINGSCYASYNPRIILAGFTINGYTPEFACPPWLAILGFIAYGVFCFIPTALGAYEDVYMNRALAINGAKNNTDYRSIYESYN